MRLMYFRGPNPDEGDEYVIFSEETEEDVPTEDYARPNFRCIWELEFDPQEGEGEWSALPTEYEMRRAD